MANAPHMGNSKVTFKESLIPNQEYRASAWLQINNGWDDNANRPVPMTPQQEQIVKQLFDQLIATGAELQVTLQHKNGADARSWPIVGRVKLFANKPQQQTSSGGDFR